ncbi:DNA adenine methylase [Turicibacter sanguinis]|uniref:DNA adenine methylase n=1 Tax=Turicibacter sanguinis TaxID=154288 RepID=UPI0018976948|nr:DNA adenine methylase [Turicibacter sanguinis]
MYRYIGNKTKLASIIVDKIEDLIGKSGTVADIMAGTGAISYELKDRGYKVFASDVMGYSKFHLEVNLNMCSYPSFEKLSKELNINTDDYTERYKACIKYLNELDGIEGYFFKEFSPDGKPENGCESRRYFSSDNAKKIDAIRKKIEYWKKNKIIGDKEEALLKHSFILAVNRVANISGTYGYFLSKLSKNSLNPINLEFIQLNTNDNVGHTVAQGYAEEISENLKVDLCYIDPPYIKRQYAANYHILETIARGDEPIAEGKSGLRPWRDQYSNFCSKVKIRDSFSKIINNVETNIILISYSEDGLLSMEELTEFLRSFGEVKVNTIEYVRFRSNSSKLPSKIDEYLIELHKNN